MTSFVTVLLVICLYTMVFGRFFCGFVCAFGAFGDALHALYTKVCKKRKKKPVKIPEKAVGILCYMKYLVLLRLSFCVILEYMEKHREPARGMYFP
ncbi:MAG: 4Fe-4S binding protein [Oliverpabstia sp.]